MGRGPREKLQASGSSMCLSNLLFSQGQKDRETVQTQEKRLLYTHSTGTACILSFIPAPMRGGRYHPVLGMKQQRPLESPH